MNKEERERIKDLKDIFNKKLENYELDKKFGQLSIDSVYSLFPTEIKLLLDYINQLETSITSKDSELLQLKEELRQLKTNRDEALNLMEKCKFDKTDKYIPISEYKEYQELKSILERGKNEH